MAIGKEPRYFRIFDGGSVMVWGAFFSVDKLNLNFIFFLSLLKWTKIAGVEAQNPRNVVMQ